VDGVIGTTEVILAVAVAVAEADPDLLRDTATAMTAARMRQRETDTSPEVAVEEDAIAGTDARILGLARDHLRAPSLVARPLNVAGDQATGPEVPAPAAPLVTAPQAQFGTQTRGLGPHVDLAELEENQPGDANPHVPPPSQDLVHRAGRDQGPHLGPGRLDLRRQSVGVILLRGVRHLHGVEGTLQVVPRGLLRPAVQVGPGEGDESAEADLAQSLPMTVVGSGV